MQKIHTPQALITPFALLLTFGTSDAALAQSTDNISAAVNSNRATVRINGSSSMKGTNERRQRELSQQSPGTDIQTSYNGTDPALRSVLNGEADLAAVGRPLTAEENSQGLVIAPRDRQKIAIIVGVNNPFTGDITFNQFAQIFRGEITDWSELGGVPGPIELIDRPETSDTRQALSRYGIFQQAPFVAPASAVSLSDDSTVAVVERLGTAGISYAIADQVTNIPDVRLVPMHGTLPSDPRYPYSQPLGYAYKAPANLAVAAFLGIAPAVASPVVSPVVPAMASPAIAVAPVAEPTTDNRDIAWWLLLLPLLGGLLLWFLIRSRPTPVRPVPVAPLPTPLPVKPVMQPIIPVVLDEPSPDIKLYEERLVAGKTRQKVGDVILDKRVETEHVQIAVPIKTDRVVIEHNAPANAGSSVESLASSVDFGVGEVRIETFEEVPDIHKETFVYEEVRVRKEIDRETVSVEETIRREELDIDRQGQSGVAKVDA